MCAKKLISIQNCIIQKKSSLTFSSNSTSVLIEPFSWQMNDGEIWLVIGPNGGGKADFLHALAGELQFVPVLEGLYSNVFANSTEIVSLERAARLIQEERENDESEYLEGGVDIGRTGRVFIGSNDDNAMEIKLCGVEKILDRGLKYMSTGEIRRTLLCHALVAQKQLLILSDPFAGLDIQSRTILFDFFNSMAQKHSPLIILGMERYTEIPDCITHVLEFSEKKISFCGKRSDYEKLILTRKQASHSEISNSFQNLTSSSVISNSFQNLTTEEVLKQVQNDYTLKDDKNPLIEMTNVNVTWGEHKVLINLNWKLFEGEHWLVRGPNGSGKTTFLELITGDNKQVYANDVKMFGNRRGSGESIWDIKKQLGIVSYRMHVEYRMLGGTSLRDVIISGFRDSIGLYGAATDVETMSANKWLDLGGFNGRESENFGDLSYGEQRAILILRSAVKCPKILILDEPCHGLDENFRQKILHLLELIAESGTTTLLHVTHDPTEVLSCEKHILELTPDKNPMYEIIENK